MKEIIENEIRKRRKIKKIEWIRFYAKAVE